MSIVERGAVDVRRHATPSGQVFSYVVRCGACGLQDESPRRNMPNHGLAYLREPRQSLAGASGSASGGADSRPWQIVGGNDANGGNVAPFVRCGDCRGDRATPQRA